MLLIAFYGKFCSFYKLFMPKIVESIQARIIRVKLSIADQRLEGKKSRKCQEIGDAGKISQAAKFSQVALFILRKCHPATLFTILPLFILDFMLPLFAFCSLFGFLPTFSL